MKTPRLIVVAFLAVVSTHFSPAWSADDSRIAKLIEELSSDEWAKRQSAEDALVRCGDNAVEALQQLMQSSQDEETRARAESALQQITENRVAGPSLITLSFANASAQEVFAEVARQARAPLPVWPEDLWSQRSWPTVTIETDHEPFWSVMQKLCNRVGLSMQPMGPDQQLTLIPRGNDLLSSPFVQCGPFLVIAQQVSENREVQFARPMNPSRKVQLQIAVMAEPKLRLAGRSYAMRVLEALDENGVSLIQPTAWNEAISPETSPSWNLSVPIVRSPEGSRIAMLRASTRVLLQVESETVEIDDILRASKVSRTIGGRHLTVESVRATEDTIQIKVSARFLKQSAIEMASLRQMQLLDSDGKPWNRQGYSMSGSSDLLQCELTFSRPTSSTRFAEPSKLTWQVATETREVELPFEFRDLPLP